MAEIRKMCVHYNEYISVYSIYIYIHTHTHMYVYLPIFGSASGIPTDEEQATGLEKIIMKAMKEGSVRSLV